MSNNHVFANENNAAVGSDLIVQPGLFDNGCATVTEDSLGTLFDFLPIDFFGFIEIDAAIAEVTVDTVGTSTPCNGYGRPFSATLAPRLNLVVQKYGRTTGLTTGQITGVNVTVAVGYSVGAALFANQIEITGSGGGIFSAGGDSGSLIVTRPGRQPVGLLFAGSAFVTIANPIDKVLSTFNMTVDGD